MRCRHQINAGSNFNEGLFEIVLVHVKRAKAHVRFDAERHKAVDAKDKVRNVDDFSVALFLDNLEQQLNELQQI